MFSRGSAVYVSSYFFMTVSVSFAVSRHYVPYFQQVLRNLSLSTIVSPFSFFVKPQSSSFFSYPVNSFPSVCNLPSTVVIFSFFLVCSALSLFLYFSLTFHRSQRFAIMLPLSLFFISPSSSLSSFLPERGRQTYRQTHTQTQRSLQSLCNSLH